MDQNGVSAKTPTRTPSANPRRWSALALITLAGLIPAAGTLAQAPAGDDPYRPSSRMLRFPDVSADSIVFGFANDLWIVPKTGGMARPLASPPGVESFPRFSPDGKTVAFAGNYDGGRDIYTLPVEPGPGGALPRRMTYSPGSETICDWAPDGSGVLFTSNAWAGISRAPQLFKAPVEGGMAEKFPVPYSGFASVSPDGKWLAYAPHSIDTRTWKRYRGGMQTDLWLFNLQDYTSRQITNWEGTDTIPMWAPGSSDIVYYLSDNGPDHRMNIWSFNLISGAREQITTFKDADIRWPSMGPGKNGAGEIIFQLGADLLLLDLSSKTATKIDVTIPGVRPTLRQRTVDAARNIAGGSISPTGKRVVVEARGEIWTAPAKEGVLRNLTRTDHIAERSPSWSPDGKWIAYFSDEEGEYNLYIRAATPKGRGAASETPIKLTSFGPGFRYDTGWSPDGKHITWTDETGSAWLLTLPEGLGKDITSDEKPDEAEGEKTAEGADAPKEEPKAEPAAAPLPLVIPEPTLIDKDPWAERLNLNWSHDSAWITYAINDETSSNGVVAIYNVKTGEKKYVTDPIFAASAPTFDRKGDFIFFRSNRNFNSPMYGDLDTTWIYAGTEVMLAMPLRADVKNPYALSSDEEEVKADKKDEKKNDKPKDDKKDGAGAGGGEKPAGEAPAQPAAADDGVSGTWEGTAAGGQNMPPGGVTFTLTITVAADGSVKGNLNSPMGGAPLSGGTYDKATGRITLSLQLGPQTVQIAGTIANGQLTGTWTVNEITGEVTAKRTSGAQPAAAEAKGDDKKDAPKKDDKKEIKIDFENIESRVMQLPIAPGNFGNIEVAHDGKIIYSRGGFRGGGGTDAGIKIFDLADEKKEERAVTGPGGFQLSADGKRLLVSRGGSITILSPTAGGGTPQVVSTAGMNMTINPRDEWRQIFVDAWRIMRDFFYEPTMHGVDWEKQREQYANLLQDAVSREDVNFVIAEMISELNIGHAYLNGPGDVEGPGPVVNVGLLGADFALDKSDAGTAYKITKIFRGGPWDTDAVGPLSQLGVDVKEGQYILAVNGTPIDTTKDIYAAFIGLAGRTTSITVSDKPVIDASAKDVLVQPIASESGLRYRAWIERNRAYVHEKSGGKIGYIYVPNTGVDGQNDLYRQFYGQRDRAALIIDERWNGGGQIPTRFIELLNRPRVSYWARRHGRDWAWPPDGHVGPKAMLINGLAGSGGDMFPWLFKHHKIGKTIGTRTWGGLVGISGNPVMIDGGSISAPTFGFYETDGTWGVEGHGVDPDIEVIDDPAKMVNGGDPQLDAAITHLLEELKTNAYTRPARPKSPNRSGMGIDPADK